MNDDLRLFFAIACALVGGCSGNRKAVTECMGFTNIIALNSVNSVSSVAAFFVRILKGAAGRPGLL
jgi:hypothetical protein